VKRIEELLAMLKSSPESLAEEMKQTGDEERVKVTQEIQASTRLKI
jgi:hypothetical protein